MLAVVKGRDVEEVLLAVGDVVVVIVGVLQIDGVRRHQRLAGRDRHRVEAVGVRNLKRVGAGEVAVIAPAVPRHALAAVGTAVVRVLHVPSGEVVLRAGPEAFEDNRGVGRDVVGDHDRVHEVGGLVGRNGYSAGEVGKRMLHRDRELAGANRRSVDAEPRLFRPLSRSSGAVVTVLVVAEQHLHLVLADPKGNSLAVEPLLVKHDHAVGNRRDQEAVVMRAVVDGSIDLEPETHVGVAVVRDGERDGDVPLHRVGGAADVRLVAGVGVADGDRLVRALAVGDGDIVRDDDVVVEVGHVEGGEVGEVEVENLVGDGLDLLQRAGEVGGKVLVDAGVVLGEELDRIKLLARGVVRDVAVERAGDLTVERHVVDLGADERHDGAVVGRLDADERIGVVVLAAQPDRELGAEVADLDVGGAVDVAGGERTGAVLVDVGDEPRRPLLEGAEAGRPDVIDRGDAGIELHRQRPLRRQLLTVLGIRQTPLVRLEDKVVGAVAGVLDREVDRRLWRHDLVGGDVLLVLRDRLRDLRLAAEEGHDLGGGLGGVGVVDGPGARYKAVACALDEDIALAVDETAHALPDRMEEFHGLADGGAGKLTGTDHVPVADEEHQLVADDAVDVERLLPVEDGVPGRRPGIPALAVVVAGARAGERGDPHGLADIGLEELAAVEEQAEVGRADRAEVVGCRTVRPRLLRIEAVKSGLVVVVRLNLLQAGQEVVVVVVVEARLADAEAARLAVRELRRAGEQQPAREELLVHRVCVPRVRRLEAAVVLVEVGEAVAVGVELAVAGDPGVENVVLRRLRERLNRVRAEHGVEFPTVSETVVVEVDAAGVQRPVGERSGVDDRADGVEVVGDDVLVERGELGSVNPVRGRSQRVRGVRVEAEALVNLVVDERDVLPLVLVDDAFREVRRYAQTERRALLAAVEVGGVEALKLVRLGAARNDDSVAIEAVGGRLALGVVDNIGDPVGLELNGADLYSEQPHHRLSHHIAFD